MSTHSGRERKTYSYEKSLNGKVLSQSDLSRGRVVVRKQN
jgi:hypothetical protein